MNKIIVDGKERVSNCDFSFDYKGETYRLFDISVSSTDPVFHETSQVKPPMAWWEYTECSIDLSLVDPKGKEISLYDMDYTLQPMNWLDNEFADFMREALDDYFEDIDRQIKRDDLFAKSSKEIH
tara:strand:- start:1380 stop:1754 length:375 start_codon:yes stop_codon:yes gene_type:complete